MIEVLWGAAWLELIDPFLFLLLMGMCWATTDKADTISKGKESSQQYGFAIVGALSLAGAVVAAVFFGLELSEAIKAIASPEFHGFVWRGGS